MEYNKKMPTIPKTQTSWLMLLVAGLLWTGCSDKLADTVPKEPPEAALSSYDGQPIITMEDANLTAGNDLEDWTGRLAGAYGPQLVEGINAQAAKAKSKVEALGGSLLLKDIISKRKAGSKAAMSTHLRLSEPDGETEEFMLSVRRYIRDAGKAKASANQAMSAENTWLALSPDRFYLQDDTEGNEQWPVTFPAVNMADSSQKIQVTFNKDGFVSATSPEGKSKSTAGTEPNLVLVQGTPIIDPCEPNCGGGGGSGGGGDDGPYCTEISGRGEDVGGSTAGTQTYFMIKGIRLLDIYDSDEAAELQMFVKRDDDYDGECFPRSYKYRFDVVFRGGFANSQNVGADGRIYDLPDVDRAGLTYSILGIGHRDILGFPLFDLTNKPGPWRLVMSDDDKDYQDFSQRGESDYADDIQTYDMSTGSWSEVFTGFSTDRKVHGSSDDPLVESGVRRITKDNVQDRLGSNSNVVASKDYSGGNFSYTFSLTDN